MPNKYPVILLSKSAGHGTRCKDTPVDGGVELEAVILDMRMKGRIQRSCQ